MTNQYYLLTAGQQTYQAIGILETEQETIIATRKWRDCCKTELMTKHREQVNQLMIE